MVNPIKILNITILLSILWIPTEASPENNVIKEILPEEVHGQMIQTTVSQYVFTAHSKDLENIVVIDAGHGGHDPGTRGKHSKEKDIALSIALKFGKELRAQRPDIKVLYTRTEDVFLPLHERIRIANRNKADLFISIHCNYAGNPNVCGSETFVMGLHRADDNLAVAKRENSVVLMENDFEKSYEGYDPNSPIGHILLSMYQNAFLSQSIDLASSIETHFNSRAGFNSRGVKQAGFLVLREATMPSVLVETGFLSNAREERYLMSQEGQQEMATKLTLSVSDYLEQVPIKAEEAIIQEVVSSSKTTPDLPEKTTKSSTTVTTKTTAEVSIPSTSPTKSKEIATSRNPAPAPTTVSSTLYTIQVGVFSTRKLKHFDFYQDTIGEVIEIKVGSLYKYMIGKFSDKEDAESACKTIKKKGIKDAFVVSL